MKNRKEKTANIVAVLVQGVGADDISVVRGTDTATQHIHVQ